MSIDQQLALQLIRAHYVKHQSKCDVFPPLKYYWFVLICFFKHSLGTEKIENWVLQSHCPSRCRNGKEDWRPFFFNSVAGFSWLARLAEEICWPTLSAKPKGSRFYNGNHQLPGGVSAQAGILSKEDWVFSLAWNNSMCVCSPLFPLYIYLYANKQQCHLETTSSALLKAAAPDSAVRQHGHRCLQLMNMQLWHLKLFSRFHNPFLHWHQFTPNHKGFQINNMGRKLQQILPEAISIHAS